jgi:hypothetical protein
MAKLPLPPKNFQFGNYVEGQYPTVKEQIEVMRKLLQEVEDCFDDYKDLLEGLTLFDYDLKFVTKKNEDGIRQPTIAWVMTLKEYTKSLQK